jgi:hypothetical protein
METITSIRVVVNEADLHDFLDETSDVDQAMNEYVVAYAKLIQCDYPGVEVEVEAGPTNGGDFIYVNDAMFGTFGSYSTEDHGEFDGAPEHIHRLPEELVNDWSWLTV